MAKKKQRVDRTPNRSRRHEIDASKKPTVSLGYMHKTLILLFLPIVVFVIYSNTIECPFIFDDLSNILENPHIRLNKLTAEGITRAGLDSPSSNRPVANISFALNYYFHKYNIMGYHIVNILIHIATGVMLYLFMKTTLNISLPDSRYPSKTWIPFFATALWLVHPIQTQSVTYIVQRMNSLAAMFYILSFFLYVKARLAKEKRNRCTLYAGSVLAGILAIGTKENAATLPFFILLYEFFFFQDLSLKWLKRHAFLFLGILILVAIVALMFLGGHPWEAILTTYKTRDFDMIQRLLTEFRVVMHYLALLVCPHPSRLNLDHDLPVSNSLLDPVTTLFSIVAIIGLTGLAFHMAKKKRVISFCILWFLGNLVIESSVIGLEIMFEHRTYLPSMLVSLMAVTVAYQYMKPKWLSVAVLCAVAIVYSTWTYERNSVWSDEIILWTDCVNKSPKKARPHNNLGVALATQGNINRAITHYFEALLIKPDYVDAHNNLGDALTKQGKLTEGIKHYSKALSLKPNYEKLHNNIGDALARQGNIDDAVSHYLEALRIRPDYAKAHYNLGNALLRQGKLKEAIIHHFEAVRINPDSADAHYNLGIALARQGDLDEAISHYFEALRINPDHAKAHNNLGTTLATQGNFEDAISHYSQALRLKPNYAKAHNNLGNALVRQGNFEDAISHYSQALRINPDYVNARRNLEFILQQREKSTR